MGLFVILNPFNSIPKQKFSKYSVQERHSFILNCAHNFSIFVDFPPSLQFCNLIFQAICGNMSCLHPSVFTLDQIVSIFRLITHITSCYKLNAITGMKKTSILLNSCYLLSLLDKIFKLTEMRVILNLITKKVYFCTHIISYVVSEIIRLENS